MDTPTVPGTPPANGNGSSDVDSSSTIFGVSVRAWLAVIIIGSVCAISIVFAVADVRAAKELKIAEPLYSMATMALGFYFGQKLAKGPAIG